MSRVISLCDDVMLGHHHPPQCESHDVGRCCEDPVAGPVIPSLRSCDFPLLPNGPSVELTSPQNYATPANSRKPTQILRKPACVVCGVCGRFAGFAEGQPAPSPSMVGSEAFSKSPRPRHGLFPNVQEAVGFCRSGFHRPGIRVTAVCFGTVS